MNKLIHIVYVSFSCIILSEKELEELLINIRKSNKEQNITGLLLYNDGAFIQVVEGENHALTSLFEKIKKDKRHENIVKLIEEPIIKRSFPNWSMGFKIIDNKQIKQIPGYSKFMTGENQEQFIKESTIEIMQLLDSFRKYT